MCNIMDKKYLRYNIGLAKRFVSDYNFPINLVNEEYFFYYLEVYEDDFKTLTKWKKLWNMIDEKFDGDENKFLDEYYQIRDKIITSLENSDAYKAFNSMDMSGFTVTDRPDVTSNNVYNCENLGKYYLSIDLKKANFQALNYVNKDILLNNNTYEEFIGKFTDLQYIKESKYTRNVIFGKLNPKRHITVEKYLINEIWKVYKENFPEDTKIVSMSNDEIVIESTIAEAYSKYFLESCAQRIEDTIKKELGLDVRAEYYKLNGYQLVSKTTGKERNPFFTKANLVDYTTKLISVPLPFYGMTYKLFNNIPLEKADYHFVYENVISYFEEDFEIKSLNAE